ncbi:hypothetical protein [Streptomyces profundus]|uniref:hypothetical protein n=1 Tax=Streptomyces profundus TaxID=2867410 RepID=UPI001D16A5F2|nr:hypothetical protein [Streptomyces sp. MA3_2.13]UED85650.1 hypothetical protein K4G22_16805 [Streptomyces sp. MA3_2.13]
MGYVLHALIARDELLRTTSRDIPEARVVPLCQGLSLVPMTDALFDAVTDGGVGELGFRRLPGGFGGPLARWSAGGPVAYAEAEYFGGTGEQRAAVWADGALALGPWESSPDPGLPEAISPISRALRRLGARSDPGEDEFQTVGLNRRRDTDAWLSPD